MAMLNMWSVDQWKEIDFTGCLNGETPKSYTFLLMEPSALALIAVLFFCSSLYSLCGPCNWFPCASNQ